MGRRLQEVLALLESLPDQLILGIVQVPDSLFKITHATVYELGTLAACAGTEVVSLDNGDLETAGCGVESHAGAGCAGSDDKHIVFVLLVARVALF